MPRNLARYEQFLRLHALVDTLANARQPIDDITLIDLVKNRLGLTRLSLRTLRRDCDFLIGCGYPLDRTTLQGPRRNGWSLERDATARIFPALKTLTILEPISLNIARDLLGTFEGTILWSGIESLRTKIEGVVNEDLRRRLDRAKRVFQVISDRAPRLADRPRMLSAVTTAIVERRQIEVEYHVDGKPTEGRLEPSRLQIRPQTIELVARELPSGGVTRDVTIDLANITRVTLRDETFIPAPEWTADDHHHS